MKTIGLLLTVLVALSGQTPATAPSASAPAPGAAVRTLVYEFGFNTKVASSGPNTGNTTIQILGPAADGGLMVSGSDFWWNTVRARATNTCEVYPNGSVKCAQRPYAISPIQLTIFPMLGRDYFSGLSGGTHATWKHTSTIYAAVLPGGVGSAGYPDTWSCVTNFTGKGHVSKTSSFVLVQAIGKMTQQGGHYLAADVKAGIAYDPAAKVPVFVSETRTHLPQVNVYNKDLVQVQLTKDSQASQ